MECSICLDSFSSVGETVPPPEPNTPDQSSNLNVTICGHVFHRRCILECIATRRLCPLCNQAVRVADLRPIYLPICDPSTPTQSNETERRMASLSNANSQLCRALDLEKRERWKEQDSFQQIEVVQAIQIRHLSDVNKDFQDEVTSLKNAKEFFLWKYNTKKAENLKLSQANQTLKDKQTELLNTNSHLHDQLVKAEQELLKKTVECLQLEFQYNISSNEANQLKAANIQNYITIANLEQKLLESKR